MILEGTTSSGAVVPVQVTDQGRVVAEGLQGPEGPQGPPGPEGPPGPGGEFWDRTGTTLSPTNDGDNITTTGRIGAGTTSPAAGVEIQFNDPGAATSLRIRNTADSDINNLVTIDARQASRAGGSILFGRENGNTWGSAAAFADGFIALAPVRGGSNVEALRVDHDGRLLVGTTSSGDQATLVLQGTSASAVDGGRLVIKRVLVNQGADSFIGNISFNGPGDNQNGAQIEAVTDGAWTDGTSQPTRLSLHTTPSGSTSPVERMRIDSQGDVIFQGAPIIKSPDGNHWAIEVDNNGNLSASLAI